MNNTLNPSTTSNVELNKRNNIIIIILISQEKRSIIIEIEKKKVSQHKKNFNRSCLEIIIPIIQLNSNIESIIIERLAETY